LVVEKILNRAGIIESEAEIEFIRTGSIVTVRYQDGFKITGVLLSPKDLRDKSKEYQDKGIYLIPTDSPLGQAIYGKKEGDIVELSKPEKQEVTILKVNP